MSKIYIKSVYGQNLNKKLVSTFTRIFCTCTYTPAFFKEKQGNGIKLKPERNIIVFFCTLNDAKCKCLEILQNMKHYI